jgi:hypothetical protein
VHARGSPRERASSGPRPRNTSRSRRLARAREDLEREQRVLALDQVPAHEHETAVARQAERGARRRRAGAAEELEVDAVRDQHALALLRPQSVHHAQEGPATPAHQCPAARSA